MIADPWVVWVIFLVAISPLKGRKCQRRGVLSGGNAVFLERGVGREI